MLEPRETCATQRHMYAETSGKRVRNNKHHDCDACKTRCETRKITTHAIQLRGNPTALERKLAKIKSATVKQSLAQQR